jgi:hypothetical protein
MQKARTVGSETGRSTRPGEPNSQPPVSIAADRSRLAPVVVRLDEFFRFCGKKCAVVQCGLAAPAARSKTSLPPCPDSFFIQPVKKGGKDTVSRASDGREPRAPTGH